MTLSFSGTIFADHETASDGSITQHTETSEKAWPIQVTVSEDLGPLLGKDCTGKWEQNPDGSYQYYDCPVDKWFNSIQTLLGNIIQYATFLIWLVGVLFIVINGIMYSIGGEDKSSIKDRIVKSVAGLILLLLSGVILNAIAPWIYTV